MNTMPNTTVRALRADRALEPGAHTKRFARHIRHVREQHGPLRAVGRPVRLGGEG